MAEDVYWNVKEHVETGIPKICILRKNLGLTGYNHTFEKFINKVLPFDNVNDMLSLTEIGAEGRI